MMTRGGVAMGFLLGGAGVVVVVGLPQLAGWADLLVVESHPTRGYEAIVLEVRLGLGEGEGYTYSSI